jgi:Tfp pilus assembly protein PilO
VALGDLTERQMLGLTAGVAAVVALMGAGLVVWQYSRYSSLDREIREKRNQFNAEKKKADELPEVRRQRDELRARHEADERRLPDEPELVELTEEINDAARRSDVKIPTISPRTEGGRRGRGQARQPASGRYDRIGLHLDIVSGFHEFGRFLNRLERKIERLVTVTAWTITADKDGLAPGSKEMKVSLDIEAYHYKQKRPSR